MKIMMTISYDGTCYCGWQRQKNGVSVQEIVENALKTLTDKTISVVASGRTDAGVHAEGQVVSFDYDGSIPAEKFYLALNTILPDDIKCLNSKKVRDDFNARKSAKRKTYAYKFYISSTSLPLLDRYAYSIKEQPDFDKMQRAIEVLLGEHDFKAFSSVGSSVNSTVRTIYSIDIKKDNNTFELYVCGSGFLYNMVRIIAGTLLDVGLNKKSIKDIEQALADRKRNHLSKTLCAKGLRLVSVQYLENE